MAATLTTDAGMHLLWDRAYFCSVLDYPTWEAELLEDQDIERHVGQGQVVPINIHADGTFVISVRADLSGTPALTEDEAARVLAASDAYRFDCAGHADVSGIEFVSATPSPPYVASASMPEGTYEARVYLLDWDDLTSRTDANPDFVLLLGPVGPGPHRHSLSTFDRP